MTLVVRGDAFIIEQVIKQLHKLIDVIKVTDLSEENHVEREMLLLKVNAEPANRAEILRLGDIFRAKVVDVTPTTYTLELTGEESKIEGIIELLTLRHPGDRAHRQGGDRAGAQDAAAQGGGAARQDARGRAAGRRRSEGGRLRGLTVSDRPFSKRQTRRERRESHAGQNLLRSGRRPRSAARQDRRD